MFLDWLPGAEGGSLHKDPGGEGDELLRGAALEEADRREIVACLRIIFDYQQWESGSSRILFSSVRDPDPHPDPYAFGPPDPHTDLLVKSPDPVPDPSINKQK